MKKLLAIVVLSLFWTGVTNADSHDVDPSQFYLKKKNNSQNLLYNIYVDDWNNHVKSLYTDNSCQGLPFTLNWLTDYTNCSYRNTKTLTKRNNMNIPEFVDAEHETYVDLFERAKIIEKKWTYDRKNIEQEATEFFKYWGQVYIKKNNYLRDVWKQKALIAQREYNLSNSNEKKKKEKKNYSKKDKENYKDYWWVLIILSLTAFYLYSKNTSVPKLKKRKK